MFILGKLLPYKFADNIAIALALKLPLLLNKMGWHIDFHPGDGILGKGREGENAEKTTGDDHAWPSPVVIEAAYLHSLI
jgi:hypothetical protein